MTLDKDLRIVYRRKIWLNDALSIEYPTEDFKRFAQSFCVKYVALPSQSKSIIISIAKTLSLGGVS